MALNRDLLP